MLLLCSVRMLSARNRIRRAWAASQAAPTARLLMAAATMGSAVH